MKHIVSLLVLCFALTGAMNVHAGQSNPINLGSAVAMYDVPLFSIPQAPLSLQFRLYYHSQDPVRPTLMYLPMGLGWTHSFNETLAPTDGTATLLYRITAEGWEEEYTADGAGHWSASSPAEIRGTVTLASNEYTVTDLNGQKTVFDAQTGSQTFGRWKRTVDRWGNSIFGTYTGPDLTSITDSLTRVVGLSYTSRKLTQIQLPGGDTWRFQYPTGLLDSIFDPPHSGATAWRSFTYQNNGFGILRLLTTASDDANKHLQTFSYDASDRAIAASSEGGTDSITIQYGVPTSTQARVTRAQSGTVNLTTDYTLIYQGARWLTTKAEGGCTSCGISGADTVAYQYFGNNHVQSKILGLDLSGSGGADERVETDYTYDANAMLKMRTEAVGKLEQRVTTFEYGQTGPTPPAWPAFVTKATEVSVSGGHSRTTTNTWDVAETQLTTTATGYLSPTTGTPTLFTTVTTFDGSHRPTSTAGPRPNQLTSLGYFANVAPTFPNRRGRLQTQTTTVAVSPASTLVTSFDNYDLYGTAKSVIDPNLVETRRTTDSKGRVLTIVEKQPAGDPNEPSDYTTTYSYDLRDRLTQVQRPLLNRIRYSYEDGTNRLIDTIRADAAGLEYERLHFTLNLLGGKTREDAQSCPLPANPCGTWSPAARTESFVYDGRNRLSEVDHPVPTGAKVLYTFDTRGNQTAVQDERHTAPNTHYEYDSLDRLTKITQKQPITAGTDVVTQYGYDKRDDLISVTDPNGNVTTYTYDDWARVKAQASPVTGTTSYTHDEAGNLTVSTDANAATTTRTYDLLHRPLSASSVLAGSPTDIVTYSYDSPAAGVYGKGRATSMTDPVGGTTYAYDRRGLLRSEVKSISGTNYASGYGYDGNGNRRSIAYPSGRNVTYLFDVADRPINVSGQLAPNAAKTYVSAITYQPFGGEHVVSFGNGTTRTFAVDARYQPLENKLTTSLTTLADFTYGTDAVGNITSVLDATNHAYDWSPFQYDDLNRLTRATSGASLWNGSGAYTYDAMGNMLSSPLWSFTYDGSTSLLIGSQDSEVPLANDAAGNLTSSGDVTSRFPSGFQRTYSARNLFVAIDCVQFLGDCEPHYSFQYDGRGVRNVRGGTGHGGTQSSQHSYAFYLPELSLLAETTGAFNAVPPPPPPVSETEYIWANGHPIAQETVSAPSATRYTFTNHLGTPILQTNTAGAIVWWADHEPFGGVYSTRVGQPADQVLRLPGQEYSFNFEDGTEENYNIFRWYHSGWGRYTQPDPIILRERTSAQEAISLNAPGIAATPVKTASSWNRDVIPAFDPSGGALLRVPDPNRSPDYAYASNNPGINVDPTGLRSILCTGYGTGVIPNFRDVNGNVNRAPDGKLIGTCEILGVCPDPFTKQLIIHTLTITHVQPCPPCPVGCIYRIDPEAGGVIGKVACK